VNRYGLPLAGWDDYSVWGYDGQSFSYFADLWRNETDSDEDPDVSVSWFTNRREIESPLALAELISARTGAATSAVVRAMAAARSAPEAASLQELADLLATPVL
jgi:hypothetical protein